MPSAPLPTTLDHLLVALIVLVWPLVEWRWYYRRSVRAVAAGVPGARLEIYRNIMLPSWAFTACVVGSWLMRARPWSALGLGAVGPRQVAIGLGFAVVGLGFLARQLRQIVGRPRMLALVRQKAAFAAAMLPASEEDRRRWTLLSITAGFCEELLFRGYVFWYAAAATGTLGAILISSLLFGFVHLYMGRAQVPRNAIVGAVFALIVLASGSLWPAMLLHAALDWSSGNLWYRGRPS